MCELYWPTLGFSEQGAAAPAGLAGYWRRGPTADSCHRDVPGKTIHFISRPICMMYAQ